MSDLPFEGTLDPRFETVREVFLRVLAEQPGTGAALAVWHDGRWVVDLWGGYADAARTRPWARDSIVMPYSVTKPFAAVCALLLADRGLVDLDAPMTTYWPELTARDHAARRCSRTRPASSCSTSPRPTEALYDWDRMCALLAEQQPAWPPGHRASASPRCSTATCVGEVVRRVDGRSLGRFLADEVCGPLGAGLPRRAGRSRTSAGSRT